MTYPIQRGVVCDPSLDGQTHINVYSRGRTELGRALTNMAHIGFKYGKNYWPSVENLWWYISTGRNDNNYLRMTPFEARKYGLTKKRIEDPDFQEIIKDAVLIKLRSNTCGDLLILDKLKQSELPLTHYYTYGKGDNITVRPANNSIWLIDFLESLRTVPSP